MGLHSGINTAALRLVAQGRVQALSCMVGAPAWAEAARALAGLDPARVDLGLHLDLSEFPLTLAPRPLGRLLLASHARWLEGPALRAEVEAQLDAFERDLGRPPVFVDGHQHVHQLPQVREALLAALARRGWRPWLRASGGAERGFKPWLIARLGARALARLARAQGLRQNGRLLGIYDFQGGPARYCDLLGRWLGLARHGDLLMCHPSMQNVPGDAIAPARLAEYAVLNGPAFAELLQGSGLRLQPLSAVLG